MERKELTQKYLKECLIYKPLTGEFIWRKRPLYHFKNISSWKNFNKKFENKIAGCPRGGYRCIGINGLSFPAHRLAWLYMKGYLPENYIDHINQARDDNRFKNLREVTNMCNQQNCKLQIRNTSSVTGVSFHKRDQIWYAKIHINKKRKYLGYYKTFEEAVMARYKEEQENPLWKCSIESSAYKYLKENNLI